MAKRLSLALVLFVFGFTTLTVYTYTRLSEQPRAYAATSSNLNFQARLLNSGGNTVPDGYYNLEFNLYTAASGGTAEWTETRVGADKVRVVNGYLSVALGDVAAFPPTINWDQDHWLTMNVGGTAAPSWDGEMTPRLKLTAVPYAFQAKQAEILNKLDGANTGVLDFLSLTANRTINLPDQDGTLCIQGSEDCVDVATTGDTATTSSNSGLEISADGLRLLGGCSDGQMLRWDDTAEVWECASGGSSVGIRESDGSPSTSATTIEFGPATNSDEEFVVTNEGGGVSRIRLGTSVLTLDNYAASLDGIYVNEAQSPAAGDITGSFQSGFAVNSVQNNSVDLGTDTVGNFVASITAGGGLTGTVASEGSTPTLTIGAGNGITVNADDIAVIYGAGANTAVQGNTTLVCPTGTGDLSGGGNTITLGSGGTCTGITISEAPVFDTSVTTPLLTNAGALTLQTTGTAGADDIVFKTAGTEVMRLLESGNLFFERGTNDATISVATPSGAPATYTFSGATGTVLTTANFTASLDAGYVNINESPAAGDISGSFQSGFAVNSVQNNSVDLGTDTVGDFVATITAGGGLTGSATGEGSAPTLAIGAGNGITVNADDIAVIYGSGANTAVQGNTTLICPTGTGDLSGGGNTITLGSGGTCTGITISEAPVFNTSVTTPLLTSVGALTIQSQATAGADDIIFQAAGTERLRLLENGQLVFGTGANSANLYISASDTLKTDDLFVAGNGLSVLANGATIVGDLSLDGSISDPNSNLVLNDTVDIGSATTGLRIGTDGSLLDIDGALVFNDELNLGSSGTGLLITTDGNITDLDDATITFGEGVTITAGGLSITSGDLNVVGGNIQTNSVTRIENDGDLVNIGNLTATAALIIANAGAGSDITINSIDQIFINSGTTIELQDNTNVTGSLDVSAAINAGSGNAFQVNTDGDITANMVALDGSTTTNGTSGLGTSTSLVVSSGANFDVGNYVQVSDTNCGGTGINPCYAKVTAKGGAGNNTLTITPALRWTTGKTVIEYHIPELGGTNLTQTLANRYGRGYFIAGVATGNGTTFYNEDGISTTLDTFNLANENVATLNIGGAASTVNIGSAATTVSILGSLQTAASETITAGGGLIVTSGGATITGGIDNNSGGLSEVGAVTGVTGITFSSGGLDLASGGITNAGAVAGASTINASGLITSVGLTAGSGLIQGTGGLTIVGAISLDGALSDPTGNLVLDDTVDLGSATNGLRVATDGSIIDIDGNLILDDQLSLGSGTTGLQVTIDGVITDLDDATISFGEGVTVGGDSIINGTLATYSTGYSLFGSDASLNAYGYFRSVSTSDTISRFEIGAYDIAGTGGARDLVLNPLGGNVGVGGDLAPDALFSVGSTSQFQVNASGLITSVGLTAGSGLIQGTGGLTIVGAISLDGALSDPTGNLVLDDTVDLGSASSGLRVAVSGALIDIDGNIVLDDIVDIGSETTGLRISADGSVLDINGDIILDDQVLIGSATTGLQITTDGVITDLDDSTISFAEGVTITAGGLNLSSSGITNAGAVAGATTINASGLITGSAGLTITGAPVNLNAGSNFAINIGTGASGAIAIGGGSNALTIDSSNFDVAASGDVTLTGNLTLSGDANEGITGGGLTDCDNKNSKLQWDATTSKFSCGSSLAQFIGGSDAVSTTWADNNTTELWNGTKLSITIDAGSEIFVTASVRVNIDPGFVADSNPAARIDREAAGVVSDCADVNTVGGTFGESAADQGNDALTAISLNTSFIDAPGAAGTYTYAVCTSADSILAGTNTETRIDLTLYEINDAGDLAEIYPTNDSSISAGEVVTMDPSGKIIVERSSKAYDPSALGVIATRPALLMGGRDGEGIDGKPVALSGRVPVKVSAHNGAIKKGDILTSSNIPGVAMKATKSGAVLGIAMSDFSGEGIGQVMLFVQQGQSAGKIQANEDGTVKQSDQLLSDLMSARVGLVGSIDMSSIFTDRLAAGLEIVTPKVIADEVQTATLTIGSEGLKFQDKAGQLTGTISSDGNLAVKGTITASNLVLINADGLDYVGELESLDSRITQLEEGSTFTAEDITQLQQLTVNLDLIVKGGMIVDGPATFKEAVRFEKNALFEGEINVLGYTNVQAMTVNLDLIVKGGMIVDGPATFKEAVRFEKDVVFEKDVAVKGQTTFNSDTAGLVTVKQGETVAKVTFLKKKTAKPIISITLGEGKFAQYSYRNVTDEGFEVVLATPALEDLSFSWVALQAEEVAAVPAP